MDQEGHSGSEVLLWVDLVAIVLAACQGGGAAVLGHLDLLGIVIVAFVASLGGGILRDVLIGAAPPNAFRDWRYGAAALIGGGLVIAGFAMSEKIPGLPLELFDAGALGLLAVAGADKAIEFGVAPLIAVFVGMITGCGGGVLRDLLLIRVPALLNVDFYGTAALAGALVCVLLLQTKTKRAWAMAAGAVVCSGLRVLAMFWHWRLPHVGGY
jgi:uncharacterized membrane protein YeiH